MVGRMNRRGNGDDKNPELKTAIRVLVTQLQELMTQESPAQECPDAPQKIKPESACVHKGLPRPFDPRPRARKCLFPEHPVAESPLPPIPALPRRQSSRVTESRIGTRRHTMARRRLVFGDDEDH